MGFSKPEKRSEGTKFLFFGEAGSGKTPTGLSFPGVALVDADSGSNFYDMRNVLATTPALSYKQLEEDLDELEMDEDSFKEIQTIAIDSLTRLHETLNIAMNEVAEDRAVNAGREAEAEGLSFREYGKIKTYYEKFYGRMVALAKQAKHLVFIAEQKDKTERTSSGEMKKIGVVPNAPKDIEFDFDVVVRTFQDKVKKDGKTQMIPKGEILKDRTGTYQVGDIVEKPSYENWKDAVEAALQGKKRSKQEIKTISEAAKDEISVVDDGDSLRREATDYIKSFNDDQKNEAKEKLTEEIGSHRVDKVSDIKKLQKAVKILKTIK